MGVGKKKYKLFQLFKLLIIFTLHIEVCSTQIKIWPLLYEFKFLMTDLTLPDSNAIHQNSNEVIKHIRSWKNIYQQRTLTAKYCDRVLSLYLVRKSPMPKIWPQTLIIYFLHRLCLVMAAESKKIQLLMYVLKGNIQKYQCNLAWL